MEDGDGVVQICYPQSVAGSKNIMPSLYAQFLVEELGKLAAADEFAANLRFEARPVPQVSKCKRSGLNGFERVSIRPLFNTDGLNGNVIAIDDDTETGTTLLDFGSAMVNAGAELLGVSVPGLAPGGHVLLPPTATQKALLYALEENPGSLENPGLSLANACSAYGVSLETLTNTEALIIASDLLEEDAAKRLLEKVWFVSTGVPFSVLSSYHRAKGEEPLLLQSMKASPITVEEGIVGMHRAANTKGLRVLNLDYVTLPANDNVAGRSYVDQDLTGQTAVALRKVLLKRFTLSLHSQLLQTPSLVEKYGIVGMSSEGSACLSDYGVVLERGFGDIDLCVRGNENYFRSTQKNVVEARAAVMDIIRIAGENEGMDMSEIPFTALDPGQKKAVAKGLQYQMAAYTFSQAEVREILRHAEFYGFSQADVEALRSVKKSAFSELQIDITDIFPFPMVQPAHRDTGEKVNVLDATTVSQGMVISHPYENLCRKLLTIFRPERNKGTDFIDLSIMAGLCDPHTPEFRSLCLVNMQVLAKKGHDYSHMNFNRIAPTEENVTRVLSSMEGRISEAQRATITEEIVLGYLQLATSLAEQFKQFSDAELCFLRGENTGVLDGYILRAYNAQQYVTV